MRVNLEKYDTMDYVLRQLRAMLEDGTDVGEAIRSLETEATLGRHSELVNMKLYAESALMVVGPQKDSIIKNLGSITDETDIGEGC